MKNSDTNVYGICAKCKYERNTVRLTNGYGVKMDLCVECHMEYMELTQKWLGK